MRTATSGPLDGVWVLENQDCEFGKLNAIGVKDRARILDGTYGTVTIISGDRVETTIFSKADDRVKYPDSRCEYRMTERWKIDEKNSKIEISETHGAGLNVKFPPGECGETIDQPQARVHTYRVEKDRLFLLLSQSYPLNSRRLIQQTGCISGRDGLIFKRLF